MLLLSRFQSDIVMVVDDFVCLICYIFFIIQSLNPNLVGGFNFSTHLKNMLVKLGIISPNRDEKETYLSCHHLVTDYGSFTIAETASLGDCSLSF